MNNSARLSQTGWHKSTLRNNRQTSVVIQGTSALCAQGGCITAPISCTTGPAPAGASGRAAAAAFLSFIGLRVICHTKRRCWALIRQRCSGVVRTEATVATASASGALTRFAAAHHASRHAWHEAGRAMTDLEPFACSSFLGDQSGKAISGFPHRPWAPSQPFLFLTPSSDLLAGPLIIHPLACNRSGLNNSACRLRPK